MLFELCPLLSAATCDTCFCCAQVEAKKALLKEEQPLGRSAQGNGLQRTNKVFVGGLAPSVDEVTLRQHFQQFGNVEEAVIMYDHGNRRPRGFGFITFEREESVDTMLLHGNVQSLHEKHIEIKRAVPRNQVVPINLKDNPQHPSKL